jgi:uncharacterized protein
MTTQNKNLNLVQKLYRAFNMKEIQTIIDMLDPEAEWGEPSNPYNPAGGTRYGVAGFLEWMTIGRQAEEILILDPRKMLIDHDSVAVVGYEKCKAIPTGKIYESDFVHLVTLKEGKVVKFQEFFDTYIAGEAFRS